jgi:hypothetical protein
MSDIYLIKKDHNGELRYTSKFTCSICQKIIPDSKGMYIYYDKDRSIKVCKTHVEDTKVKKHYGRDI